MDRSIKNVDISKLPNGWLDTNKYIHPLTKKTCIKNLFSKIMTVNPSTSNHETVNKTYSRFSLNQKQVTFAIFVQSFQNLGCLIKSINLPLFQQKKNKKR